ncbi:MAG: UDP-N-acetylmuramate--L-alanine ligase, partial [Clostridia bacterium]|nr:UDP-N-acetylmuramate--L-alanine ligase [Clostridia bacterium]
MWLNENGRTKSFYFIGIGGISMSGLAKLLRRLGYATAGSDLVCNEQVKSLKETGIPVYIGERAETAAELRGADVVVFTDAIPENDTELLFAMQSGKELLPRAALLKQVCGEFRYVTAVAGSHGKTTCTSICAHILKAARLGFAAHIGGEDVTFGNFYMNGFEHFLTEACEYKKNVKEIHADRAILLNIDKDHMECYRDEADLTDTFQAYCKQAKTAIVCSDDERAARFSARGVTFGIKDKFADYRA